VPTVEQARKYAATLDADPDVTRALMELITDLRMQHDAGRRGPGRSGATFQNRVHRLEAAAARVEMFHPLLIPGALQTAAYVRAVFSSGDLSDEEIDARTAARLKRGALITNPNRAYTFLTTYGALGWRSGTPETMAQQVEHLAQVSKWPNVRLGVIPWGAEARVYPSSGFDLYDRRTAMVGLVSGARLLNRTDEVKRYVTMLGALEGMAVFDDDARALLDRVATKYRSMA
jgi:hypothetical protein